jgi:outer membrane lipoprotein LolB
MTIFSFIRKFGISLATIISLSIAVPATAQAPAEKLRFFSMSGRIDVIDGARGEYHGKIKWVRYGEEQDILMMAPTGKTLAMLTQKNGGFELMTSEGHFLQSGSSEELLQKALGYQFPLNGLDYWVQGTASPLSAFQSKPNAQGQFDSIAQDGWDIRYGEYFKPEGDVAGKVPRRITAVRGDLSIKVSVDNWIARNKQ